MGDVSIIARRLDGGKYVQYGWSGNGGYYRMTGNRLLCWYDAPELVDYLFGLGQMRLIGRPHSEDGGCELLFTNQPENTPHWLGKTEREIFSKIAFIDYGYFYDTDNKWYYVDPDPFRIKIPLEYIDQHLDDRDYEFEELGRIKRGIIEKIFGPFIASDSAFHELLNSQYPQGPDLIKEQILADEFPIHCFWEKYKPLFDYFDDWILIKTDKDYENITDIVLRKKQDGNRIETIDW